MVQSSIELEFKPEIHPLCYLLDAPVLLAIIAVSYLFSNVFNVLTSFMTWVMFISIGVLLFRFFKHNRACDETEVKVFPDRIESEVGMKNPKLTMIEFSNLKEVKPTQSFIQKAFKTYSIMFTYKSDFDETKDLVYVLRDFKNPRPICDKIKKAVEHAGLIGKMTR